MNLPPPMPPPLLIVYAHSYFMWCPGCDDTHKISDSWQWNGDRERPTFTPSILVTGVQWPIGDSFHKPTHAARVAAGGQTICHSFLTDGVWNFLGDCTHDRAGQSVPMVPVRFLGDAVIRAGGEWEEEQ